MSERDIVADSHSVYRDMTAALEQYADTSKDNELNKSLAISEDLCTRAAFRTFRMKGIDTHLAMTVAAIALVDARERAEQPESDNLDMPELGDFHD